MRSSVSVILSRPAPDLNMLRPDYEQTVYDHAALLILVRQIGEALSTKYFNQIFDKISRITLLKIKDNNGVERTITARFVKEYPVGNNDWGDFQAHRRLLGLITIGKCNTEPEYNEICRVHESLKVKYQATLYDTRCVVVGANADGAPSLEPPSYFKSRALYFATEAEPVDLEEPVNEFLFNVFWILESRRAERMRDKIDKIVLLLAPFEKRDFVGLDMKSHSNRKRCIGRHSKHLGDLSLQAGLTQDALTFYHSAIETLKSINDWLWIGSCAEGLCAASALFLFPRTVESTQFHRNASLQDRNVRQRSSSLTSVHLPDKMSRMSLSVPREVLTPDEIYKNYREAIIHYSKYQNAGVIETEACFKGARIAVKYNSALQAHTILQNVIFINLTLNEEDKIQRLMNLSQLYTSIGFHRKAAFFRRLTATRYVSGRNPETNWNQCYQLMLQSLPGYNLSLELGDSAPDKTCGWPSLQRQVLHDLVVAATRLSNGGLATRHMTFLLQTMWHSLTPAERLEAAKQLKCLAELCEGSPVSLVLDNGFMIPPANLLNIPQPLHFVVQNLKPHLRPHKLHIVKEDYGPFLFTPLPLGSSEKKNTKSNKLEYLWVAEEVCEVILEMFNPLPLDLEVTNILLLVNGIVFECIPVSIVLPGGSSNQSVVLSGIPKETGELEITGYSTHTLGVKSNCRLRYIPSISQSSFILDVVPALPLLEVSVSSELDDTIQTSNSTIVMYAGESLTCNVQMNNTGSIPVEFVEVTIESLLEPTLQQQILQWSEKSIQDQLPLAPGSSAILPIQVHGVSNFIMQKSNTLHADNSSIRSSLISGTNSFPSFSSPKHSMTYDKNTLSASFSYRSGGSSLNSTASCYKAVRDPSKIIECHIKVRYSGGPGLEAEYCRVCSFILHIEIANSVLITNWDVLQAETSSQFYLVLDILNLSNHEIELDYASSKFVQIEENESCRLPIPVDRCPIAVFEKLFRDSDGTKDDLEMNRICSEHIASQVDLIWKLNNLKREGRASLTGLTLSSSMLDIVRVSPINWEVAMNEMPISGAVCKQQEAGEPLQLGVRVCNSSSWPLLDVTLKLNFYQDYENGVINQQLDACLATVGATEVQLPTVTENGSVYHECVVVFFNAGQFKLNIQCSSSEKYTWKLIPPIEIEVV